MNENLQVLAEFDRRHPGVLNQWEFDTTYVDTAFGSVNPTRAEGETDGEYEVRKTQLRAADTMERMRNANLMVTKEYKDDGDLVLSAQLGTNGPTLRAYFGGFCTYEETGETEEVQAVKTYTVTESKPVTKRVCTPVRMIGDEA